MTLLEVVIAVGMMMIISLALVSFVVSAITLANNAKIKSTATFLANQKMEQIKATEEIEGNKLSIQAGDWSSINGPSGLVTPNDIGCSCGLGTKTNFFTRKVEVISGCNIGDTQCLVKVTVSWTDKNNDNNNNISLTTLLTKW